jgi:SOS-response transcriptional repressor LexA
MSASAAIATCLASYSLVQAELPGHGLLNLGVLLHDSQSDSLRLRLRRDMHLLAEEEDLELLQALADDLLRKAEERGAEHLFQYLESTLSGTVRISNREPILVEDLGRAVERLYRQNVQSNVLPFQTHLPRYSLRAAAGKFLDNEEVVEEGWLETPENMPHLYDDMFVSEIVGHSMEPRIPDGSFCIFRANVEGSRSGRLVLVEDREAGAYAVKRYNSEKLATEGTWRHQRIHLESLNPGYPSWDLDRDEQKYRIIAEFIRVVD